LRAADLSLVVSLAVAWVDTAWVAVLWLLSLALFLVAARAASPGRSKTPVSLSRILLLVLAAALPVAVRIWHMDPARLHQDEFITGYFSATEDFRHSSFFGLVPADTLEWVTQFPKPFFLLQKAFFAIFGATTATLRLSVLGYVAVASLMLFLIAEEIFDRRSAVVAVALASFFAPSVYLETLGLHFISATAIFTVFFYLALRLYRTRETWDAALAGIACGCCYLTYYSSYLAFPVLVAFLAAGFRREKRGLILQNAAVATSGLLIVVAPFLAWSLAANGFTARRASQINLLTGTWSPHRQAIAAGASPLPVIRDSFVRSCEALVRDGLGGAGGYDFGHLALLDRVSFGLLAAGALAGFVLLRRKTELLFVYLVIGAAFLFGVVLTIPPPAFHRFSIAFPFLVLLMTLPFWLLWRAARLPTAVRFALAAGLVLLFIRQNERHLGEAILRDQPREEIPLVRLLRQKFLDRKIAIAGSPNHHVRKVLYFQDVPREWAVRPVRPWWLVKRLNPKEPYVYVLTFAEKYRKSFEAADPKGHYYRISAFYGVFAN
jgi:hypothetical protein